LKVVHWVEWSVGPLAAWWVANWADVWVEQMALTTADMKAAYLVGVTADSTAVKLAVQKAGSLAV